MEFWIQSRGYSVVAAEDVRIANYAPSLRNGASFLPTSIDQGIPYILEKLFQNTIAVRVLQKTITKHIVVPCETSSEDETIIKYRSVAQTEIKQLFLFVRDAIQKKCSKKDLTVLCQRYIPLADCILFASGIAPQLEQLFFRRGVECKHDVQILQLKDATFDKLESRTVSRYILLNEAEICDVEERLNTTRDQFPRLNAKLDPIGRYLGLRTGMVVQCSPTYYRFVTN